MEKKTMGIIVYEEKRKSIYRESAWKRENVNSYNSVRKGT